MEADNISNAAAKPLSIYSAVVVECGQIRRLWFEAPDEAAARSFCLRCNAGFEGPSAGPDLKPEPIPEAYDQATARKMLGGISRATLYRFFALGHLDRVPGTWRVLVTRSSLERFARSSR